MRTCEKPQFWQLSSTRTPGWYFNACERKELCVRSKILASSTFTRVGAKRRLVTLRVAETTTSPRFTSLGTISKSETRVASEVVVISWIWGSKPGTATRTRSFPTGRFFNMKWPVTSVVTEILVPSTSTSTWGRNSCVSVLRTWPTMWAGRLLGVCVVAIAVCEGALELKAEASENCAAKAEVEISEPLNAKKRA